MTNIVRISACAVVLAWTLTACISMPQGELSELQEQEAPQAAGVIARNPWTDVSGVVIPPQGTADLTNSAPPLESSKEATASPTRWSHFLFPGKVATSYRYVNDEGRDAMMAQSIASSSMLRRVLHLSPDVLGVVHFSWKVHELIKYCGLAEPADDDSPARVILTFAGDRTTFSAKNAILSELTTLLLGEPLPYATLAYLWSAQLPLGSIVFSPRTDRVRSIVVESGRQRLGQWQDYERKIHADYVKAFGEAPGALLRIAIMTDNDNTCSQTRAWYGPLRFSTVPAQ